MSKIITISVFTENKAGLLQRVTTVFTRRKINIDSLTVSESEIPNIDRYTIVVEEEEVRIQKVVQQLEKQVEVHKAFYHLEKDIVYQEIAQFKRPTSLLAHGGDAERWVRKHHARVLAVEKDFTVIEKSGHKVETQALFDELAPYGILEFVRSGRIAISKPMKELKDYLRELEHASIVR